MTSLVKAIQERLAKICDGILASEITVYSRDAILAMEHCAAAIRAADLSDLEPKGVEGATPRTKALKQKWSTSEGSSNSTCSQESHEIYMLAEDLERKLAALTARLEAAEGDARRYRWLRDNPDEELWALLSDINEGPLNEEMQSSKDAWDAAIDAALKERK